MTIRMAIIDGTGEDDDAKYKESMKNSFCRQLGDKLGAAAHYERGPGNWGTDVLGEATRAAKWLFSEWKQGEEERLKREGYNKYVSKAIFAAQTLMDADSKTESTRLMLAGYSRGGSAAIMAAQMLDKLGVPVDSLFLFDAVARHLFPGGEIIPANVRYSRHARRSQSVDLVLKYEGTISDHERLGNTSNPMRPSFGNTGLQWKGTGDHMIAQAFVGSHGALGGVGWAFIEEDPQCQRDVAAWMNRNLRERGVHVCLEAKDPTAGAVGRTPGLKTKLAGSLVDLMLLDKHYKELATQGKVK